jgi:hypothetical protein
LPSGQYLLQNFLELNKARKQICAMHRKEQVAAAETVADLSSEAQGFVYSNRIPYYYNASLQW